jgi:hypothetical protein
MITIKNKKNLTWRQCATWLFVFLLTGSFLFGENVLAFGDYNKADGSRLDPAEWNGLTSDFVNTWQTAAMTGPLGIGTNNPGAYKLNVNGNTNITGILNASSFLGTLNAANISSGIFGDNLGGGNYSFPGSVGIGIGTAAPISPLTIGVSFPVLYSPYSGTQAIIFDQPTATSGSQATLNIINQPNPGANSTAGNWGLQTAMQIPSSSTYSYNQLTGNLSYVNNLGTGAIGVLQATQNIVYNRSTGAVSNMFGAANAVGNIGGANATNIYGAKNSASNSSGNVSLQFGSADYSYISGTGSPVTDKAVGTYGYIYSSNTGSGVINNAYSGYFDSGTLAARTNTGTITNAYGVYIGSIYGTNKWSLYANDSATPSYFAGSLGIGIDNPGTYKLNVNGNSNITGTLNVSGVITGGGLTGVVSASNVSAGDFASSTGGGNFSFPGNVGIGTTVPDTKLSLNSVLTQGQSTVTPNQFSIYDTPSTVSGRYASQLIVAEPRPTADSAASIYGLSINVNVPATMAYNFSGSVYAQRNEVDYSGTGSAAALNGGFHSVNFKSNSTLNTAIGATSYAYNMAGGTVTNMYGSMIGSTNQGVGSVVTTNTGVSSVASNTNTGLIGTNYAGYFQTGNSNASGIITNNYGVYIKNLTNGGTITNTTGLYIGSQTAGTQTNTPYGIYQAGASDKNYFAGSVGIGTTDLSAAKLVINAGTGMALKAYGDGIFTGTLQTQTGSDFAEEFSTTENLEPGTVVVMGDGGYKSVHPCDKEYDSTVVGIVSNNPSIIAGRVTSKHKAIVAMMGVVKVNVIDINGKISKGDRLTTSGISGYAMKADDSKPGTIIGKALEDLTKKSGEINVLVNLQ